MIFNISWTLVKNRDAGQTPFCIKDGGDIKSLCRYDLVKALKEEVKLPIQMHTHYTSGMGSATYLKAIEAGADVIDTANSALALGTSAATETMVAVLNDAGFETGIDLNQVSSLACYFKESEGLQ